MKSGKHCRLRGWLYTACVTGALCLFAAAPGGGAGASSGPGNSEKLSPELRSLADGSQPGSVNVIVQQEGTTQQSLLGSIFNLVNVVVRLGGRVTRSFGILGAVSARVPARSLRELASRSEVRYVSLDRTLVAGGHVETTTGTAAVRTQTGSALLGLLQTTTTLDGSGVGIAVIDSGLDARHEVFRDSLGFSRVSVSLDFTGEGRTDDPFGHGTHVASIAAGSGKPSNGAYAGIAPAAKIVNLRVLNSEGKGTTSRLARGARLGLAEPRVLQDSRRQPLFRRAGRGHVPQRPGVRGRAPSVRRGRRGRGRRGQRREERARAEGLRRRPFAGARARGRHRRRVEQLRDERPFGRPARELQLARADARLLDGRRGHAPLRQPRQARPRRARQQTRRRGGAEQRAAGGPSGVERGREPALCRGG